MFVIHIIDVRRALFRGCALKLRKVPPKNISVYFIFDKVLICDKGCSAPGQPLSVDFIFLDVMLVYACLIRGDITNV